ncbi:uncharacterized protein LOC134500507 [Candoia aspera]|uniref:uncharacterized protein LOC134500507 n=1 Tax=Candoia aspera TaxID=51853 RepID=UPI002FD7A4A5
MVLRERSPALPARAFASLTRREARHATRLQVSEGQGEESAAPPGPARPRRSLGPPGTARRARAPSAAGLPSSPRGTSSRWGRSGGGREQSRRRMPGACRNLSAASAAARPLRQLLCWAGRGGAAALVRGSRRKEAAELRRPRVPSGCRNAAPDGGSGAGGVAQSFVLSPSCAAEEVAGASAGEESGDSRKKLPELRRREEELGLAPASPANLRTPRARRSRGAPPARLGCWSGDVGSGHAMLLLLLDLSTRHLESCFCSLFFSLFAPTHSSKMAQEGAVMCFHPNHAMSCQHYVQEVEKTPWLSPSKNVVSAYFNPNHSLSPSAGKIHVLRKGLTPEPLRSQLGIYNSTGSLTQKITKMSNIGSGSCPISGRVTAPCTPLRNRHPTSLCPSGNQVPLVVPVTGGQSSVVTFRFIEKANVKTLNGFPLIESRKENGLSRSIESEEAFHFESNKQRSHNMNVQPQYSLQHEVRASLNPIILDNRVSFKVQTDKSFLTFRDEQDPAVLSSKQEHLGFRPKPEISASDPLLAGNRFLLNAQHLNWGNGSPLSLGASCPSSSLTSGMSSQSNDLLWQQRHPQSRESQYQGSLWAYSQESSAHAQRVAKAKWEFFYGSMEPSKTDDPSIEHVQALC